MYSSFDPELKITPVKGKVFDSADSPFLQLKSLPEIEFISENIEDNVLIRYREKQTPAIIKGVSDNFGQLTHIEDILLDGEFKMKDEINNYALLGVGLASNLGVNAGFLFPLDIYAPKRNMQVNMANPASSFSQTYVYIGGVFMVNQAVYDENYLIVPIDLVKELFDYDTQVSALEIKLKAGASIGQVQKNIQQIIGNDYFVKNRYQQQETVFRMISIEKWVIFLILCFILLIAVFNIISLLSMLIVDKQADITILRNLGADSPLISKIFLFEGWMISALGAFAGLLMGIVLCWGQQHFGWLKLGTQGAFAVNAYPVRIEIGDLVLTLVAAILIGFLAVQYPVRYLSKRWLNGKE
jgi:ABC-type lipoprotein release transport system permease subunit